MLSIQLHAQNIEENINRYYGLRVNKNLFGAWTITIQYTKFRTRGPSKLFFCDTLEEAKQRVNVILKRRLNYNRRVGCQYRIVHVDADPSIMLSEWIPDADLMLSLNLSTPIQQQSKSTDKQPIHLISLDRHRLVKDKENT